MGSINKTHIIIIIIHIRIRLTNYQKQQWMDPNTKDCCIETAACSLFLLLYSTAPAHRDADPQTVESNQSFNDRVQHSVCLREQTTISRHGAKREQAVNTKIEWYIRLSGKWVGKERRYVCRGDNEGMGNRCAGGWGDQVTGICGNTLRATAEKVGQVSDDINDWKKKTGNRAKMSNMMHTSSRFKIQD